MRIDDPWPDLALAWRAAGSRRSAALAEAGTGAAEAEVLPQRSEDLLCTSPSLHFPSLPEGGESSLNRSGGQPRTRWRGVRAWGGRSVSLPPARASTTNRQA